MSRRTSLAVILLFVAVVLVALARRESPVKPGPVTPASADAPVAPPRAALIESNADPSLRAPIADPVRQLTVSGTVRDAQSKLAGATVSLWLEKHSPAPLAKVVTGADGAFSFPVEIDRTYLLACTAPGHDECVGSATPGKPVVLYLAIREATIELYGHVQTPDGKPVTSFEISVVSVRDHSGNLLFTSETLQSPTGEFRVQVRARIESATLLVRASAPGFDPGANQLTDVRERTSTDVGAIELKPLRTGLVGTVEDAVTHKPIGDAQLEALCDPQGPQREVKSAPDGTFQLSILPDQVMQALHVTAAGYAPRVIDLAMLPLVDGRVRVELGAGATIHGLVTCVGAAKRGDLYVECWERHGRTEHGSESMHLRALAQVGANGEFELTHVAPDPLYLGLYRQVGAGRQHEMQHSQLQTLWPREGQKTEVEFRIGGLAQVRTPIRAPRKGFGVFGRLLDSSGTMVSMTETVSGADLTFCDVAPGRYEIRVCTADVELYLARSVDVGREDLVLDDWDLSAMPRKH